MNVRTTNDLAYGVTIDNGVISRLESMTWAESLPIVLPKYCDIQVNGAMGIGLTSDRLTVEKVHQLTEVCQSHGTGPYCPTVITQSHDVIIHAMKTLANVENPAIAGIHLEGPYLSPDDGARGAHPKAFVRPPDVNEFSRYQDAAQGKIRIVTLAPELPGAIAMIEWLVSRNIIVAIGHTNATRMQLNDAVLAGASLTTHLGNGCPAMLPRHDNVIWNQLAEDRLLASVIADGHHLPKPILQSILRAKSSDRIILISDAGTLAGLPPGRYRDWDQEFDVLADGRIVVPGTPYLAGSGVFLDQCVNHLITNSLANWAQIEHMACINPRRLLGLPIPELRVGESWSAFNVVRISAKSDP